MTDYFTGHPSPAANSVPSWSPDALLNPNRQIPTTPNPIRPTPRHTFPPQNGQYFQPDPNMNSSTVFQFASPNEVASAGPSSRASTPSSINGQGANPFPNLFDNLNNVQDRSTIPRPKRRRLEDQEGPQGNTQPMRGGSGGLGAYVKEQQKKGNGSTMASAMTVDLTDGIIYPLLSSSLSLLTMFRKRG